MGLAWKDQDRIGDIVVLIPGVCMPCVLRRLDTEGISTTNQTGDDQYQLVGTTYIHGIMDGEFLKKNIVLQTFTLY